MKDNFRFPLLQGKRTRKNAEVWFSATTDPGKDKGRVVPRIPSSFTISLSLALSLSVLFVLIRFALSSTPINSVLWEGFLFAVGSFLIVIAALERYVYRNLAHLQLLKQKEIEKLKSLEAYRREFLGEVSHELKTPIFAIQGFIHTLLDGAMNDDKVRLKFLRKAMKNSDRLSNLVEDLLVITQAESGEMEVRFSAFNIMDLAEEVLDSLEYRFKKKEKKRNVTISIIANHEEETVVIADRERIQQVLTNLIDNAVKYGKQGGRVNVELTSNAEKVYISVTDDGPGIEGQHLDKIFRRFYRVDKSRSRDKGGTGLGLAICKHLLTAHGESISVKSKVGVGTTFTFSLKKQK